MVEKLKTYKTSEKYLYLLGMAGQNIIYNVIAASLAYYLQFTILIPAIAVGTMMTLARIWDAFNDPMMGTLVDRTRTKIGKCRPYLLAIPAPILVITVLCFLNFGFFDPSKEMFQGNNALIVIWAAVTYVLWGMTYTVGDIPLWSLPSLMTENKDDRNKLLSLARVFGGIGGGIALLGAQPLAIALGKKMIPYAMKITDFGANSAVTKEAAGERLGFVLTALIFGVLGCGLFQLVGIFSRERIKPSEEKYGLGKNFSLMWTNKPFRQILLSGLMGSPKFLLGLAAMPLVSYYYANKDPKKIIFYMVILGGGMFVGQFVAMAIAPALAKKYGKKHVYNYGNLVGAIPFISIFMMYQIAPTSLTDPLYIVISFVLFLLGGGANGFTSVMSTLMISDAVDYEEYHNGIRPDGVFFSGQSFLTKLNTGIATMLSAAAYTVAGFTDSAVASINDAITQGHIIRLEEAYRPYMMVLFFIVSIPPAIGSILSVIPTWHYCLDEKEHERILGELNAKRHAQAPDGHEKAGSES